VNDAIFFNNCVTKDGDFKLNFTELNHLKNY
jgi:hypothetical protein